MKILAHKIGYRLAQAFDGDGLPLNASFGEIIAIGTVAIILLIVVQLAF